MSSEYAFPLTKIKIQQVPLFAYDRVILRKNGQLHLGTVVSHLELEEWSEMNNYKLLSFETKRLAINGDRTSLISRSFHSTPPPNSRNTIVGVAPPVTQSSPPPSSRKMTLMGIPVVSNQIRPLPIKIIG